jgi:hypothetical protein
MIPFSSACHPLNCDCRRPRRVLLGRCHISAGARNTCAASATARDVFRRRGKYRRVDSVVNSLGRPAAESIGCAGCGSCPSGSGRRSACLAGRSPPRRSCRSPEPPGAWIPSAASPDSNGRSGRPHVCRPRGRTYHSDDTPRIPSIGTGHDRASTQALGPERGLPDGTADTPLRHFSLGKRGQSQCL